jgi:regulator of PEP synthase PpsR (kinase-PPPase family)
MHAVHPKTLYVVSDGTGQTGTAVLEASLVQFQGQDYAIVRKSQVRTVPQVEEIVEEAARTRGVVFYTLVAGNTRDAMHRAAAHHAVSTVDILGQPLAALHDVLQESPKSEPGLLDSRERRNLRLHEAVDFAKRHDDGLHPEELGDADVVLVGVSRAGKSVTCFYLACQHGVKAANVPLVPGQPIPPELLTLPKDRVVGLLVDPKRLRILREAREPHLGIGRASQYADDESVEREVRIVNRMILKHWTTVEASRQAVEEIAHKIMQHLGSVPERSA